jgi:hypothetical protein
MHTQKSKLNNFFPNSLVNFNNLKNITLKINFTMHFIFGDNICFWVIKGQEFDAAGMDYGSLIDFKALHSS